MHRLGLIGAGRIGIIHGTNAAASPDARLVALTDPDPAAAERLATRTKAELRTVDEIIDGEGIDAVLICSPTDTHADLIERCARAGKAIFCEKPIDLSVPRAERAVAQAEAGVDICAPSGMMDGQVAAIRSALDSAGAQDTAILAYSAKYASALYGPFRDAVGVEIDGGEGVAGDRRGYQQDHRNLRESLLEIRDDVEQGADMVMVKPALSYLDVITAARGEVDVPLAAYHVSGEYAMVHAAAERGWLDLEAVAVEQTTAIKRAGADFVLTYFARLLAEMAADGGLR